MICKLMESSPVKAHGWQVVPGKDVTKARKGSVESVEGLRLSRDVWRNRKRDFIKRFPITRIRHREARLGWISH